MCGYRCLAWGLSCWALLFASTRRRSAGWQVEMLMINRKQKVDVCTRGPKRLLFYFIYLIAQNITEKPKQKRYIACVTNLDQGEKLWQHCPSLFEHMYYTSCPSKWSGSDLTFNLRMRLSSFHCLSLIITSVGSITRLQIRVGAAENYFLTVFSFFDVKTEHKAPGLKLHLIYDTSFVIYAILNYWVVYLRHMLCLEKTTSVLGGTLHLNSVILFRLVVGVR